MYLALLIVILALLMLYLGSLSPSLCIAIAIFASVYFLRELRKYLQREQERKVIIDKYKAPYGLTVRYLRGDDFLQMEYLVLLLNKHGISLVGENHKKDYPLATLDKVFMLKFADIKKAILSLRKNTRLSFCGIPEQALNYWQALRLNPYQDLLALLIKKEEELSYVLLEYKPENKIRDNIEQFMPLGLLHEWNDSAEVPDCLENVVPNKEIAGSYAENMLKQKNEDSLDMESSSDENNHK